LEAAIVRITNPFQELWKAVRKFSSSQWKKVKTAIELEGGGPDGTTCPQAETVILSLTALFIFFIIAIIAIRFPTIPTRHAVLASNAILAGALGTLFAHDVTTSKLTNHEINVVHQVADRVQGGQELTAKCESRW
jgi:hypothetical protein